MQPCSYITHRFVILYVLDTTDGVQYFRDQVVSNLRDGAAYTPYLNTVFSYDYNEADVQVTINGAATVRMSVLANTNDTYHRFLIAAFESSAK